MRCFSIPYVKAAATWRALRCLVGLLVPLAAHATPLPVQLVAQPFPPLQYPGADGQPTGYVQQFVNEILHEAAGKLPITVTPLQWLPLKRALQQAEIQPNTLVLGVARTPERETRYVWLGEVAPYNLWVYKTRNRRLKLKSPADMAGKGLHIGVQDGANFHEWLKQRGIGTAPDNNVLDLVPQNELNFRKLQLGRIDLLAQPEVSFHFRIFEQGLRPTDFEPLFRIKELSHPLWLATGPNSDPALVDTLRRCLAHLKAKGRLQALQRQHEQAWR